MSRHINLRGSSRRAQGFTLVELLLAVTLLSILLALAYGGFRASTKATNRGQDILQESSRLRLAHQFVHRQLNQILPLSFADPETDDGMVVFEGGGRSIRYVGPMPGYLGFGGPQVQELSIVNGEDGLQLVLSHALLQGFEESALGARDPSILIDDITCGSFGFQGRDEQLEPGPWSDSWEDTYMLPVAVSLNLNFGEEAHMEWPELVSSVRIDGSAIADLIAESGGQRPTDYSTTIQNLINRRGNDN